MNQEQTELTYTGINLLIKMVESRSPRLFRKIQWIAGIAAALWACVIAMDNIGLFAFMNPHSHLVFVVIVTAIGAMLTGSGLVAKLPTTDPSLVSQDLKDAILNQAVKDGIHVPVTNSPAINGNKTALSVEAKDEGYI